MRPFRTLVPLFFLMTLAFFASPRRAAAVEDWVVVSALLALKGAPADFTPHGTQPGLEYGLTASGICSGCHDGDFDQGDASTGSFRPFSTWGGSMMANATRDPLFWAALDVANHDVPGVGDYCLRCHTSQGWYGGRVVKTGSGADNDITLGAAGCLLQGTYDKNEFSNDFGGLTCHFCHRLSPTGPNGEEAYLENGNAWVDDAPCANPDTNFHDEPCRRGPYTYSSASGPVPPHAWQHSDYHADSAICGTCHNVSTPDTDTGPLKTLKLGDGTDTGRPFPIERTFAEWQQSDYSQASAQSCQSCHMPTSEAPNATACSLGGYPNRTGDLPVHAFVGGNTWIPRIIKGQYDDTTSIPGSQGGLFRGPSFDQTEAWARDQLGRAAALDLAITAFVPPAGSSAGSLSTRVKVTNLSGHKLPTGYSEGRRMWVNVEVHDANGRLVYESAAYDAASAVLTLDPQARVYETLQGIWNRNGTAACDVVDADGDPMFHFALSDCIAKDTRIPPLGFKPATADDPNGYELRPVPEGRYPETSPGSGTLVNYDVATYAVAVPAGTALPLSVNARLYYQTSSREYIEFLRNEAVENGFAAENAMCSAAGNASRPFVVGPQDRTRGEYIYELWNNDPSDADQPGYGKSPPELMQVASDATDRLFANGFDP